MKKVICVVEDEKAINDLVAQYLKKEGYEVRSYYTYEEASAHVEDDDVHLWILDIMLDDKSGFDLIVAGSVLIVRKRGAIHDVLGLFTVTF